MPANSSPPSELRFALAGFSMSRAVTVAAATILAPCDTCGQVVVAPTDLTVVRYRGTEQGWYRFVCPRCGQPTTRDANGQVFALLAGVPVVVIDVELELVTGPVICLDDLIDLHADLARL